jgi:hypothetical protein
MSGIMCILLTVSPMGNISPPIAPGTESATVASGTGGCQISLNTDGTITGSAIGTGVEVGNITSNWYTPTTPSVGATWYVRLNLLAHGLHSLLEYQSQNKVLQPGLLRQHLRLTFLMMADQRLREHQEHSRWLLTMHKERIQFYYT